MAVQVYGKGTKESGNSVGGQTIQHFYDRAGIKMANAVNVVGQFASRKWMPKKYGKTFKVSKFMHIYDRALTDGEFGNKGFLTARSVDEVNAKIAASQLNEGAGATNELTLEKVTIEATLARYGNMITYTDEVDLFSEDYMQVRYREELGEYINQLNEDLMLMDMLGTPTVMYSGAATSKAEIGDGVANDGSTDSKYKISYDLIRRAVRRLVRNRSKKNTTVVTGSTKIDTKTIPAAYYALIGADVKADLETLTRGSGYSEEFAYVPFNKYGDAATAAEGEVGAMHEVRFIEVERMPVYRAAGAAVDDNYAGTLQYSNDGTNDKFDVFPILFPTQDAFACVGLKGEGKVKFYAKPPSDVDLNNPYGTKGFFSANFFYAGLITREEALLCLYCAASK